MAFLKGKKKVSLAIYVLIAALAVAAGAYYVINNRPSADTANTQEGQQTEVTTAFVDNVASYLDAVRHGAPFTVKELPAEIEKMFRYADINPSMSVNDNATALSNHMMEEIGSTYPELVSRENGSLSNQLIDQWSREMRKEAEVFLSVYRSPNGYDYKLMSEHLSRALNNDINLEEIASDISKFNPDFSLKVYLGGDSSIMLEATENGLAIGPQTVIEESEIGPDGPYMDDQDSIWAHDSNGAKAGNVISPEQARAVYGNVSIMSEDHAAVTAQELANERLRLNAEEEAGEIAKKSFEGVLTTFLSQDRPTSTHLTTESSERSEKFDPDGASEFEARIRSTILRSEKTFPLFQGRGTIAVNRWTGNPEYTTQLCYDPTQTGKGCLAQGYFSFDPTNNTFSAQASAIFGEKKAALYSDPITGDVYMAVSRADEEALLSAGKVQLMSAIVSKDGRFGGTFKYGNRMFRYNPTSNAFEVPIAVGKGGSFRLAEEGDTSADGRGDWGTVYIDSNGNITGKVDVFDGDASIFFDRTGRVTVAVDIPGGSKGSLGSVGISSDGSISGSIDIGKAIGFDSVFVGIGSGGITGINAPIGSFMGNAIGVGIGADGGLSIGGFIPIAGLPIPVGIGQSSDGGFRLSWPGGSLGLGGGDSRPQSPPELEKDEEGNVDAGSIYFKHNFRKYLKKVSVYQVPSTKIEKEEQVERGQMIFDVYNDLLGRNPGLTEFTHWYFYAGHQLYDWPRHETDKAYRMEETEKRLRKFITGSGGYKGARTGMESPKDNLNEYKWIQQGKPPLDAPTRPEDIMEANPFDESVWERGENTDAQTGETKLTPIMEFLQALLDDMRNDPGHYLARYFDEELDDVTDDSQVNIDYDVSDDDLSDTDTVLITGQGDYPVIEKTADNNNLIITLRNGFNEVFVPEEVGYVNTAGAEKDGLKVFEYDPTYNSDPNQSWLVNPDSLKPGTGYYIHNSGDTGRKIRLAKRPGLATGEKDTLIKKGWNLLAYSGEKPVKIGDYMIEVAQEGWSGGCDVSGLCTKKLQLRQIIKVDEDKSRAFETVHFLVPDSDPLELRKLVSTNVIEDGKLNNIELKRGQLFWIYLFE